MSHLLTSYSITPVLLLQLTTTHIISYTTCSFFISACSFFRFFTPKKEQVNSGIPCSKLPFFYISHSLHFIYYLLLFYISLLLFLFFDPKKEQVYSGIPCSKVPFFYFFYISHSLHCIYYLLLFYISLLLFSFFHPKKEQVYSGIHVLNYLSSIFSHSIHFTCYLLLFTSSGLYHLYTKYIRKFLDQKTCKFGIFFVPLQRSMQYDNSH